MQFTCMLIWITKQGKLSHNNRVFFLLIIKKLDNKVSDPCESTPINTI
ncbi:unnamed protein product [Spirodela intermedia]|uniref:Uncharacterized protein n=2 Tax=Spirodela intermedia TaxID=51605 RepID=A0A7I8JLV6_SPIIN|nr:unnamed protein product [Spirodela intermedia]CAA6670553.1 unnamed protein product [Spirodela intermedia]CAA7407623.1 unnamed protein product [Spirodela intermedia]